MKWGEALFSFLLRLTLVAEWPGTASRRHERLYFVTEDEWLRHTASRRLRERGSVSDTVHARLTVGKPIYWPYPASGAIQPGSEAVLRVTTMVDEEWSRRLSTGEDDTNGKVCPCSLCEQS